MSVIGHQNESAEMRLTEKIWHISWSMVLLICLVAMIGFAMLFSASNGSLDPWAERQMVRFGIGLGLLIIVALIDLRFWMRYAYLIYGLALALLISVEVFGAVGMGAQRWIDIGFFQLQPSEIMKVALVLALARYFHGLSHEEVTGFTVLFLPLFMILIPAALVLRQPDLGTAILLVLGGGSVFFLAGARLWLFGLLFVGGLGALPVAWQFLRDYQKQRVLTFINPESDPLGGGYHIMQSKIALGSGGLFGKGFLQGSQSHLNFLPEKQTDFIFTMLAEEFGIVGGLGLLTLYMIIIIFGFAIALRSRNQFGRLVALGLTTTFFLYVFINIAMVMGLIPVVGVPLPLVSYGGTAMLSLMFSFGIIMSVCVHKDMKISRRWVSHAD